MKSIKMLDEPTPVTHVEELRKYAQGILDEVMATICGPRIETYGPPQESFNQIAEFWEAYLSVVSPAHYRHEMLQT